MKEFEITMFGKNKQGIVQYLLQSPQQHTLAVASTSIENLFKKILTEYKKDFKVTITRPSGE